MGRMVDMATTDQSSPTMGTWQYGAEVTERAPLRDSDDGFTFYGGVHE